MPGVRSHLALIYSQQLTSSSHLRFLLPHHSLCCTVGLRDHIPQCVCGDDTQHYEVAFFCCGFQQVIRRIKNKNLNAFLFSPICHSLSVNTFLKTWKHILCTHSSVLETSVNILTKPTQLQALCKHMGIYRLKKIQNSRKKYHKYHQIEK